MSLSIFDDKNKQPDDNDLAEALGEMKQTWDAIKTHLEAEYGAVSEEWKFSGQKWGWAYALKLKKRRIVYLTPCKDHFILGMALGGKAVAAATESGLSEHVLDIVNNAKKYAEGTAVRLEVRSNEFLEDIKKIIRAKVEN
ncbi:MAG: DUF3788 domain-containing protein [bacterium]